MNPQFLVYQQRRQELAKAVKVSYERLFLGLGGASFQRSHRCGVGHRFLVNGLSIRVRIAAYGVIRVGFLDFGRLVRFRRRNGRENGLGSQILAFFVHKIARVAITAKHGRYKVGQFVGMLVGFGGHSLGICGALFARRR